MATSFAGILAPLKRRIPASLLDGQGWERIIATADTLPPSCMDAPFGFELRLDNPRPEGDLLITVPKSPSFAKGLAEQGALTLSEGHLGFSLGTLLAEREDRSCRKTDGYYSIILEYDLIGTAKSDPLCPGVFMSVIDRKKRPDRNVMFSTAEAQIRMLHRVVGWDLSPRYFENITNLIKQIPHDGLVTFVGAMPERIPRYTRMNIAGCSPSNTIEFLDKCRWHGDVRQVYNTLSRYARLFQRHVLAIDISKDGISSRVGLELFQDTETFTTDVSNWNPLLKQLVTRGHCHPSVFDGLNRFSRSERLFTSAGVFLACFGINHAKIVLGENRTYAKIYIAVRLRAID